MTEDRDSGNQGGDSGNQGGFQTWVLLSGNRFVVAAGISLAVAVTLFVLSAAGLIALGPNSNVRTLLSSGLASGLLTLVTISLSINQLLLSRVFGSPGEFADQLDATSDFRERASSAVGSSLHHNDPKAFLRRIMAEIRSRSRSLDDELPPDAPGDLSSFPEEMAAYADKVVETIGDDSSTGSSETMDILETILGPEYAYALTTVSRLQEEYSDTLSESAEVELETVLELLRVVAIFRQFLKTMAIQQDLARLSRLIAYTGVVALTTTFVLALVFRAGSGAVVPAVVLPTVVSVGLGIVVLPLALFVSYLLRIATLSRYTVSVGSFIPPEEQFGS